MNDPATLGPYEIDRRISDTGSGTVFLGRSHGRPVLIKTIATDLARDAWFRQRLTADIERLRQLNPFCLAAVLGADIMAKTPYVVVEYVDAPTLAASIEDEGPLAAADTVRLALGLAAALATLHRHDLAFTDLKPTNLVLSRRGLRLVDFGLARVLNTFSADRPGQAGRGMGNLSFLSPEQLLGRAATVASDVFTWGGVVLYAATGQAPFGGGPRRAMLQRVVYAEPDLSVLPATLRELVGAAMGKDPRRRPTAGELFGELAELVPLEPTVPRQPTATDLTEPTRKTELASVDRAPIDRSVLDDLPTQRAGQRPTPVILTKIPSSARATAAAVAAPAPASVPALALAATAAPVVTVASAAVAGLLLTLPGPQRGAGRGRGTTGRLGGDRRRSGDVRKAGGARGVQRAAAAAGWCGGASDAAPIRRIRSDHDGPRVAGRPAHLAARGGRQRLK
ncbi:serine/threonine protein kinase [Candidatus Frankia nodulisporulans]|uniref:serine/threonine protein kinase n=1 Tax=Candidatus Frankia nodulisporulans TaxID=2060052 RepID=UPI0013D25610|nr:serine/threonine-protein kinase [Candidatus Frankia nodulisporulans]